MTDLSSFLKIVMGWVMNEQHKPTLLLAKGDMSRLGGAERDLLRVLPSLTNYYQVKISNSKNM